MPVFVKMELDERNIKKRDFILKLISKYLVPFESSVLEVGVGNGRFGFLLAPYFMQYFGIDSDEEQVKSAKMNIPAGASVNYQAGKGEEIPFKGRFDVMLYANSWHFLKDFNAALDESDRVLEPDGVLLILEPTEKSRFADSWLNSDSPNIKEKLFKRKMEELTEGRDFLLKQKKFLLVDNFYEPSLTWNVYVLRKKLA